VVCPVCVVYETCRTIPTENEVGVGKKYVAPPLYRYLCCSLTTREQSEQKEQMIHMSYFEGA
jgi:hypothetical protein